MPEPFHVLSFSAVFPRPDDRGLGLFVAARLQAMAEWAEVSVVAPVAWVEYGNQAKRFPGKIVPERQEGRLAVRHPRWLYLPGLPVLTPLLEAVFTLGTVRRREFDVLDVHFGYPEAVAGALLAAWTRKPFTVTLRGNETSHAQNRMVRRLLSWALRRAGRVITVSERLRQFAIGLGVDPGRAVTIPNGINPAVFYPRDRAECRARLGMGDGRRHVLSVGYLIPRKGHEKVIAAVGEMRRKGQDVELWILGNPGREGSSEPECRALVERLGLAEVVHFVGAVPHTALAEYMTAGDVLCLASSREGWPNVVHEALACGCPVVATDVGGVPDMIPGPEFGRVVPIGDEPALRAALSEAVEVQWDRQAIAEWGHRRTWSAVAQEALEQLRAAADLGVRS